MGNSVAAEIAGWRPALTDPLLSEMIVFTSYRSRAPAARRPKSGFSEPIQWLGGLKNLRLWERLFPTPTGSASANRTYSEATRHEAIKQVASASQGATLGPLAHPACQRTEECQQGRLFVVS